MRPLRSILRALLIMLLVFDISGNAMTILLRQREAKQPRRTITVAAAPAERRVVIRKADAAETLRESFETRYTAPTARATEQHNA